MCVLSLLGMQHVIMSSYVYKVYLIREHLLQVLRKCIVRGISLEESTSILPFTHLLNWQHSPNRNHFAVLQSYPVLMSLRRYRDGFCCQLPFSLTLQWKHQTRRTQCVPAVRLLCDKVSTREKGTRGIKNRQG